MLLRSRIVLPISTPPIEDGAVLVSGGRIEFVGRWIDAPSCPPEDMEDLGECVLLPGLINAHCHLDYTDLAGFIPPPKRFTDWLKALVALKGAWTNAEFVRSWQHGASMLLLSGTTTVADIEAVPDLLPWMWQSTPLRVISFREIIGIRSSAAPEQLVSAAAEEWAALPDSARRCGLSPHAPYTTNRQILEHAARAADRRGWRLTTHVAESEEEFEMFLYRHGPLFTWLEDQRDMSDCGQGSPIHHLDRCGYLESNLLAVHVNYLWRDDALALGRNGVTVVHCPRSHAYFQHLAFSYDELISAGVNICLGTDSLVSTQKERGTLPTLDLFAEMRQFHSTHSHVSPSSILRMVTVNPAKALGHTQLLGEIAHRAQADLIAVPYASSLNSVEEAVLQYQGPVRSSFIAGRSVIRDSIQSITPSR